MKYPVINSRNLSDVHFKNRLKTAFCSKRGAASALIILLVVLLVFFGVLAMVTAAADFRLSEKRADWTKEYFNADSQAEWVLAEIDNILADDLLSADIEQSLLRLVQQRHDVTLLDHYTLDDSFFAELRVFDSETRDQGIQMTVRLRPDTMASESEMMITSWIQWQPAPEAADRPGLWDGD